MKETSKMYEIRKKRGDFAKYLKGYGIDIGAGNDPLTVEEGTCIPLYQDGENLNGISDNSLDFVYASHSIEHLPSIDSALKNWARVLRDGGFVYAIVPDFMLYEKGVFPSKWNAEHKHTFSLDIARKDVKRDNHYGKEDIEAVFEKAGLTVLSMTLETEGYDKNLPATVDQTLGNAVCQICVIAQKGKTLYSPDGEIRKSKRGGTYGKSNV